MCTLILYRIKSYDEVIYSCYYYGQLRDRDESVALYTISSEFSTQILLLLNMFYF